MSTDEPTTSSSSSATSTAPPYTYHPRNPTRLHTPPNTNDPLYAIVLALATEMKALKNFRGAGPRVGASIRPTNPTHPTKAKKAKNPPTSNPPTSHPYMAPLPPPTQPFQPPYMAPMVPLSTHYPAHHNPYMPTMVPSTVLPMATPMMPPMAHPQGHSVYLHPVPSPLPISSPYHSPVAPQATHTPSPKHMPPINFNADEYYNTNIAPVYQTSYHSPTQPTQIYSQANSPAYIYHTRVIQILKLY